MKDETTHPAAPDYCTQNGGHCPTCSLVNYRRDCMNNPVDYERFAQYDKDRRNCATDCRAVLTAAARAVYREGGRR